VFPRVYFVCAVFLLSACSQFAPLQKRAVPQDQMAYSQVVDVFRQTHQIELLKKFKKKYPDSAWAERADTLMLYALEVEQRKAQLAERAAELETLEETNQQLTRDLDEQLQANQQLLEQLEQLKGLLIQLEQRPQ
jgi:DNA repair exonuclease SbcCD ATPase subunit